MSATKGMRICFLMAPSFSAASRTGTATRTISHPAASRPQIWSTVASTLRVSVLVIDWTVISESPPTWRFPSWSGLVRRRGRSAEDPLARVVMGAPLLEELPDEGKLQDVVADGEDHEEQEQ